jgi:hypothetical protein
MEEEMRTQLEEELGEKLPEEDSERILPKSTKELVQSLYKDDYGNPFVMTEGQEEIFDCIFYKQSPDGKRRIHIETHTQYGKSDTVAMAVLTRASTYPEKWAIVAPTQSKAKIIMGYVIKHLFENEYTAARFKMSEGENEERIRRERSKSRLTFDIGRNQLGEVFILSAESRLKREEDVGNALMGFGAPNLVEDEAALISDESDAKAMRMVGGFTPFATDFVVKIGNPFTRGHFLKSYEDENYHKIVIDYERGIKEGRMTKDFIEEMRAKPYFRVLYECKFPTEGMIDSGGWSQLLSEDDVDRALDKEHTGKHAGERRLGTDVARGGANYSAWVLRSMNFMEMLAKSKSDNLIDTGAQTMFFMKDKAVLSENTFIDDVGVGGGVADFLKKEKKNVRGTNVGHVAVEDTKFANMRAEAYWRLREWIKRGGKLSDHDEWYQLTKIKYKPDTKGRLRVMSKDDMRSIGVDSPDVADAAMLTFVRSEHSEIARHKKLRMMKKKKIVKGRGLHVTMGGY